MPTLDDLKEDFTEDYDLIEDVDILFIHDREKKEWKWWNSLTPSEKEIWWERYADRIKLDYIPGESLFSWIREFGYAKFE